MTPPSPSDSARHVAEWLVRNCAVGIALTVEQREKLLELDHALRQGGEAWIPVSEQMPEFCKSVLLIAADVEVGPWNRYTTDLYAGWATPEGKWSRWPHPFPPTHWQPLPTPPAQTEDTP